MLRKDPERAAAAIAEEEALDVEPIRSPWMQLDPLYMREVRRIRKIITEASKLIASAARPLNRLHVMKMPIHEELHLQAIEAIRLVTKRVRDLEPMIACPYCKNVDALIKLCAGCNTTGYLTRGQVGNVPPRFLELVDPVVACNGKMRPLDDFVPRAPPPGPAAAPVEPDEEEPSVGAHDVVLLDLD